MIPNFEDFCLMVYVTVDDLWRWVPDAARPRGEVSQCSDPELITMLLVGECMGWHEETVLVSQWRTYRTLFPHQPDRTRLNRRRRRLSHALTLLRQIILRHLDFALDRQCAVDSLPVPVIGFHLVPGAASAARWRECGAAFGKVVTKKQTIFGSKLHLLVTLNGVIRDFVLAPANLTDGTVVPELLDAHTDLVVVGDKGYLNAPLAQVLWQARGIALLTPTRRNQQRQGNPVVTRCCNGVRQIIATVNDQLTAQFALDRHGAQTFAGLYARLISKLTAHTLCIYVNRLLGKADCLQIKALAFPN